MAYIADIPKPTDQLRASQPQLRGNSNEIPSLLAVNHVPFTGGADDGKHTASIYQARAALPLFGATETGLWNQLDPITGKNETFIHNNIFAGGYNVSMSSSVISNNPTATYLQGWTMLPSGILIHWGATAPFNGLATITLPAPYKQFTQIFTVVATPHNTNPAGTTYPVRFVDVLSNTQFRLSSTGLTAASFIVIGV